MKKIFQIKFHWQIFIAMMLGAVVGIVFPNANPYTAWLGILFMNALSMLIVPLILFSIISGITGAYKTGKDLKKLGFKTGWMYIVTMLIAIFTGLVLVNIIQPGRQITVENFAIASTGIHQSSVSDIVTGFVPSNIIAAMASNNTLPVILIAFLVGICISKLSAKSGDILTGFVDSALELTLRITRYVIYLSPLGIFAIVVKQFASTPDWLTLLKTMLLYVITVLSGLAIHMFGWMSLIMVFYKINPWKHLKNMSSALITAFSTASSGATLPVTLYAVEHKNGVSHGITSFAVPLGTTLNMAGTALLECVAAIFIAQAYGMELGVVQQIIIVATSLLCAIGAAAIPMAGLVMMTLILNAVGLPIEGIGLVIGVDRILDMARTAVNVYGDTCVATMIAKSEGEQINV